MKKARLVIAMVIVAMMTSMFSFASADSTVVKVKADKTAVNVGDQVTVTFSVEKGSNIGAIDMDVAFDADDFELVEVLSIKGHSSSKTKEAGGVVDAGIDASEADYDLFAVVVKVLDVNATITGTLNEVVDASDDCNVTTDAWTVNAVQFTEYETPAEPTTVAPTTKVPETGSDVAPETGSDVKDNPNTGVVACTAAVVALAASSVVLVKSKRK